MANHKLRFGCDVDGVVYPWDSVARTILRQRYGSIVEDRPSVYWSEIPDTVDKEQWNWLWSPDGGLRMLFTMGEPYPGAVEAVQEIAGYADVVIITSVPGAAIHDRTDWLARHRIPCAELHVTTQSKHLIQPHCDVYIDDGPHNVQDLRNHTSATILIWDRPWNREERTTDAQVRRVYNWQEVVDFVRHASLTQDTYVY